MPGGAVQYAGDVSRHGLVVMNTFPGHWGDPWRRFGIWRPLARQLPTIWQLAGGVLWALQLTPIGPILKQAPEWRRSGSLGVMSRG